MVKQSTFICAKTSFICAKTSSNGAISRGKCRNLIDLTNLIRIIEGVHKAIKCLAHPLGEEKNYVDKCLVRWRAITDFIPRSPFIPCVNVFQRGGKSIGTRRKLRGGSYIPGVIECMRGTKSISSSPRCSTERGTATCFSVTPNRISVSIRDINAYFVTYVTPLRKELKEKKTRLGGNVYGY